MARYPLTTPPKKSMPDPDAPIDEDQEGEITLIRLVVGSRIITQQELVSFFKKHKVAGAKAKNILTQNLLRLLAHFNKYNISHVKKCAYALIKTSAQVNKFVNNHIQMCEFQSINALHIATLKNSLDMTSFLLAHGAQVNLANKSGVTPLITALFANNDDTKIHALVQLLVERGAHVNAKSNSGITALSRDCARNFKQTIFYLIENSAYFNTLSAPHQNIVFRYITTPLESYALLERVELLEALENSITISLYEDIFASNALLYAAAQGHTFMVEKLLSYAAPTPLAFMLSSHIQRACHSITLILARQQQHLPKEIQENYARIFKRLKEYVYQAQPPCELKRHTL